MKRVIPSVILAILLVTLLSELFKLIDFYRAPAAFALLAHVSAVHDVVLHQYDFAFLLIKLLASLVVFAYWCRVVFGLSGLVGCATVRLSTLAFSCWWVCWW